MKRTEIAATLAAARMRTAMHAATVMAAILMAAISLADPPATAAQDLAGLSEFLKPALLKLGLMPNLDGLLDGDFEATVKWSPRLSSGLEASYSGSSDELKDSSGASVLEAKTFSKDYAGRLRILEFLAPVAAGESLGFGLGGGLSCAYTGLSESVSGYKTVQGETVYFNQDRIVHRVMPTLDLSVAAAFGRSVSVGATGSFIPLVYMVENGRKLYSTYDTAIPYSLVNACRGWRAEATVSTLGLGIGDLTLKAEATGLFGKYGTRQEIVTGNYKTTIETYADYRAITGDASLEYRMSWLRKAIGLVPALALGFRLEGESMDGIASGPGYAWRAGISLGSR